MVGKRKFGGMKISRYVVAVLAVFSMPALAAEVPSSLVETPVFEADVAAGKMPAVFQRLPKSPRVIESSGNGLEPGRHGGELDILMGNNKDTRQMVVYGYARLVVYDRNLELVPDIAKRIDVEDGRIFTIHLRENHKWSDGHPFTAEDFRYWWHDVANDKELSKLGPPAEMLVEGQLPEFKVIDTHTVRYSWTQPNPHFLSRLAGASPFYIYRPSHYLKQFDKKYADPQKLEELVKESKRRNWVALHFAKDRQYKNDNPEEPTLQPWVLNTKPPSKRFVFKRNPYFHRVDINGRQLPYIDQVNMTIASSKLIPAKTGTGESDLQARGLAFNNYTFLKQGEARNDMDVRLWDSAKGSQVALFPNLNHNDPEFRKLFRDVRFRRALSLAIDRHEINQVIFYGLATEANNTVLPESPLYKKEYATRWAALDIKEANRLLDEIGLTRRGDEGIRVLPDGRPLELTVETAGESTEEMDVLQLIHDTWLEVGIKIFPKASQREVLRNRVFQGATQVSVWSGLENGVPTRENSPEELAPTTQQQLQWPKWGQYLETKGKAGEKVDMPVAVELANLNQAWNKSGSDELKRKIWEDMLEIHADQVFTIGLVSRVPQPVVVNSRLRNVPEKGIYNWDPGAHFGMYQPDTFWFADPGDKKPLN
jgi:peptide/nickel transport system substrate-binding protein